MRYRIRLSSASLLRCCVLGFIYCFAGLSATTVLSAQEPNESAVPAIRMLHVFIQADTEIVRFDNIWVFGRETTDGPWRVQIDLPKGAELLRLDDPNRAVVSEADGVIDVNMTGDSLVDSVGFSYLLANEGGRCRADIIPRYQVDSAVVSVSGTGTGFSSSVLSASTFRRERSRFSSVYAASGLSAGAPIDLELTALPSKDTFSRFLRIASVVGLGLILAVAGLTMYRYPKSKIEDSDTNEAGSK